MNTFQVGLLFLLALLSGAITAALWYYKNSQKTVRLIMVDRDNDDVWVKRVAPSPEGWSIKTGPETSVFVKPVGGAGMNSMMGRAFIIDAETGLPMKPAEAQKLTTMDGRHLQAFMRSKTIERMIAGDQDGMFGLLNRAMPWLVLFMSFVMVIIGVLVYRIASNVGSV